jgi:molybdate transport system permease protein
MLDAARTLGWSERRVFFRLMLPLAWPSIAAGTVLAFARAMGEFGATMFVAGNYAGVTETMPIAIYFQWMGGRTDVATFWVFVVVVISFIVILFINLYASHTQRFRRGGNVAEPGEAGSDALLGIPVSDSPSPVLAQQLGFQEIGSRASAAHPPTNITNPPAGAAHPPDTAAAPIATDAAQPANATARPKGNLP